MSETKKEKVPTVDSPKATAKAARELKNEQAKFAERMKKEKKVKVFGNPMYAQFVGKTYTYLHNGLPVTITFDGEHYEYPETIAKNLEKKLSRIAKANTPKPMENIEL